MGLPYWNSDIGGFQAYGWHKLGGTKCPEYQELYLRWMQFGLFSTMMRSHGTGLPREIWRFGERGDGVLSTGEVYKFKIRFIALYLQYFMECFKI